MGQYLSCGIAKTILVKKNNYSKEEILQKLSGAIDINIYDVTKDSEEIIELELKKDIMEKYAVKFVEEQLKIAGKNIEDGIGSKVAIKELENKNYDELIQSLNDAECYNFQFIEGGLGYANDISYISKDLDIYADIIEYISDGKIIMECWYSMFRYIRNLIVNSSNNPIKTAAVITFVG